MADSTTWGSRKVTEEMTSGLDFKGGIAWGKRHAEDTWQLENNMMYLSLRVWLGGERKGEMDVRSGCKDGFRVSCKGHKYHTKWIELCVDKGHDHHKRSILWQPGGHALDGRVGNDWLKRLLNCPIKNCPYMANWCLCRERERAGGER